jgi:hypothetical protein
MSRPSPVIGVLLAWVLTVVVVAFAVGVPIEHPEYLSMPLAPFALMFSFIFVGLPLGFGLLFVQRPAFDRALQSGRPTAEAWRSSILANAAYAATLTIPLSILIWMFGEVSPAVVLWAMTVLVACSLVTSLIWLCCNHVLLRKRNA